MFVLGFHASHMLIMLYLSSAVSCKPFEHLPLLYPFAVIISFVYSGVFCSPSYANMHLHAKLTICGQHLLILSHWMWWCMIKWQRTWSFSADFITPYCGHESHTLHRLNSKLEMDEAANSYNQKLNSMGHILSIQSSSNSCCSSSSYDIWAQSFTNKAPLCKFSQSLFENLF